MEDILIKAVLAFATIVIMFSIAGLLTWVERKQSAVMQDRIGANRASIFGFKALGLFHAIADVLKMLSKEEFIPKGANKFLFNLAPYLSAVFALVGFAAIPIGNQLIIGNKVIELQAANINVALLFVFAMMSMGVYGVVLAGFSSNNNYAFLGGMRGAAQMIAYEITMGAAIMGVIMVFNTLDLQMLVRGQGELMFGWLPKWGVFVQPLSFLLFLTAATAETKRTPFDLPEGESEIIGYFVEYSGMKFGMFFLADLVETVLVSALMTTLFFGGWQVPYLQPDGFHLPWAAGVIALPNLTVAILGMLAFFTKLSFFIWVLMAVRWTLPRFRYDQLMRLGWKILLPVSLINIVVTAIVLTFLR